MAVPASLGGFIKKLEIPDTVITAYNEGESATQLSLQYNCSVATMLKHLRARNVEIRHYPNKINLSDTKLRSLYLSKHMSTWEIERRFGYSRSTIHRHVRKLGINRDLATSHFIYKRRSFPEDLKLKAYLQGFAIGDLRVRKVGKLSKTIKVDCESTKKDQVSLFKSLFGNYGRVWTSKTGKSGKIQMETFLDESFSFLLDVKDNYGWVANKNEYFVSFFAGFVDAEGSFFISKIPHFSLGNYNLTLLRFFKRFLFKLGIRNIYIRTDKRKGTFNSEGYMYNDNYNILEITKKSELLKLISLIEKEIKHRNRQAQISRIKEYFRMR